MWQSWRRCVTRFFYEAVTQSFRVVGAGNIASLFLELIYLVMISTCLQGKPQKTLHNNINQSKWCLFFYTSRKVFKIKQQWGFHLATPFSPKLFKLLGLCLASGCGGFRILSGSTGSRARERMQGDGTPLLDLVESQVVRGTMVYAGCS